MVYTVSVVDDHPLIRRGFASAINESHGLEVLWTATTIAESVQLLKTAVPHVIVVDLGLSDGAGLELIRMIRDSDASTKVLVSSMQDESVYASRCLKAGASGYISKSEPVEKLIEAIRLILSGEVYLSQAMTSRVLQKLGGPGEAEGVDKLSDRELQVLEMIGSGMDTKTIAKEMHISPKTVDSFRERIKAKLQISNATELIHFAVTRSM